MLSLRIPETLETKLLNLCREEKKTKTKIIQESLLLYIESKKQSTITSIITNLHTITVRSK